MGTYPDTALVTNDEFQISQATTVYVESGTVDVIVSRAGSLTGSIPGTGAVTISVSGYLIDV
jgi:hypothetical protein